MYGTVDKLKTILGFNDSTYDNLLTSYLEAASRYVSMKTRKSYEAQTRDLTLVGDYVFDNVVFMPRGMHVRSITLASDNNGPVDLSELIILDFDHRMQSGTQIWRAAKWSPPVALTIEEGYTASPPPDIVEATLALAADWFNKRLATGDEIIPMLDHGLPVTDAIPAITARVIQVYLNE